MENPHEHETIDAKLVDDNGTIPSLIIAGESPEAAITILEIPGNLSGRQIDLVKNTITKTLNLPVSDNTVAIARVFNKPTFGQIPIRIQLPKTSAARLILKFQLGDVNVEPQDAAFIDRFGLPPAFDDFTGREDSLALLEVRGQNTIIGNSEITDSTKKTVSGTGGIGKTQLAVTFAHNKLNEFQKTQGKCGYRSVVWFIAGTDEGIDNQGLMMEQMQRLGVQLGFDPKKLTPQTLIKLIYERLEKEHGPYLVVFDNAQDLRSIQSFCPPSSVSVIVTTRNFNEGDWGQSFKFIPLTVFTDKEAHLYIKKVLCRHHEKLYEEKEANALANALGNFPLALTQALAYITNENMRITEYLVEFRQQKELYLQQPVVPGDPYQDNKNPAIEQYAARPKEDYDPQKATVWTVIQLSLKKVINPNANQILKACAYLAPEAPIDVIFLSNWAANLTECREAITALRHYSLLENVALANHVRIHQLVQEILRLADKEEARSILLACQAEFIEQYYEKEENTLVNEARRKILFPHCQVVLKQIETFSVSDPSLDKEKADLQSYTGLIYSQIGNHVEAVSYYKKALAAYESSQSEIKAARTLANLGTATLEMGDAVSAKTILFQAYAISEKLYSLMHPQVAIILMNLGNTLLLLRDASQAKVVMELALTLSERIYSPDHLEVAKILINLSAVYLELGYPAQAKTLIERAKPTLERTYGFKHPEIAKMLLNLGTAYLDLGNLATAKTYFEQARTLEEQTYGPDHYLIVPTLVNLSSAIAELGDTSKAVDLLKLALVIKKRTYGPTHPEVAFTLTNLGGVYVEMGNMAEAKTLLQEALSILLQTYGPDHALVAKTLVNLGNAYAGLGDLVSAMLSLNRALAIEKLLYEPEHPEVAITLMNIGKVYLDMYNPAAAKAIFTQVLASREKKLGPNHLLVAKTIASLGDATAGVGDPAGAIALFERALPIFELTYGSQHPEVAKILVNLGNSNANLGNTHLAKAFYERALSILENTKGADHPMVASTHLRLGMALYVLGQHTDALNHFRTCAPVLLHHYGEKHPFTILANTMIQKLEEYLAATSDPPTQIFKP